MIRRLSTACALGAVVWAAAISVTGHAPAGLASASPAAIDPVVPAGLRAPQLGTTPTLRSLVAADIDHDGDLDVVGIDGALDLVVWINDGTGQLTARPLTRSHGWRSDPPGPTIDDQQAESRLFVPAGSASAGLVSCTDPTPLEPTRACVASPGHALRLAFISRRTPRAPPAPAFSLA